MTIDFNTKEFLSIDELAIFLNISKTSAYRLIYKRVINFYKVGGMLRIKRSDILLYLDNHCINSIL